MKFNKYISDSSLRKSSESRLQAASTLTVIRLKAEFGTQKGGNATVRKCFRLSIYRPGKRKSLFVLNGLSYGLIITSQHLSIGSFDPIFLSTL